MEVVNIISDHEDLSFGLHELSC